MRTEAMAMAVVLAVASARANPVVWLHGWNSDASLWDDLKSRFVKSAGADAADFLSPSYYSSGSGFSVDTPIEEVAAQVARQIQDFVDARGDGVPVDVVAHSMGGLVFRSLVAQECLADDSIVRRFATLGTPHYGQNAEVSFEARQMKYGSDFLWELGCAWHFDGRGWPATNTLCIAGITDFSLGISSKASGSYWDGLVHAWSAALGGGVPTRYVYRCHSSALVYAKAPALCKAKDGSKDAVFCLLRDFLRDGSVPDDLAPTYGGDEDSSDTPGRAARERRLWSLFVQALSATNCVPFSYDGPNVMYRYQVDGDTPDDNFKEYGADGTAAYDRGVVQVFGNLPLEGVHYVGFNRPDGTTFSVTDRFAPEPGSCRFARVYDGPAPAMTAAAGDATASVPLSWIAATGLVANADSLADCTNALARVCANGYTGAECWRYGISPWDAEARAWLRAEGIALAGGAVTLAFGADAPSRVHVQRAGAPDGPFAEVPDAQTDRTATSLTLGRGEGEAGFFRLYRR